MTVPQSRFEGSDRQIRGRLVDALRQGPMTFATFDLMSGDLDPERLRKILRSLIKDGLVVDTTHGYELAS